MRSKSVYALVTLVGLWLLAELASALAYRLIFHESPDASQVSNRIEEVLRKGGPAGASRVELGATRLIHPYYGYVFDDEMRRKKVDCQDPYGPQCLGFSGTGSVLRSGDSFVVAIIGGSVAWEFATFCQGFLPGRIDALGIAGDRRVIVLNLANGGYKQPQQLMVLTDLIALGARLDLVIAIDGFNEIVLPMTDNVPMGVFPYFPRGWKQLVDKMPSPDVLSYYFDNRRYANLRQTLARAAKGLVFSNIVRCLWRVADTRLELAMARNAREMAASEKAALGSLQSGGFGVSGNARATLGPRLAYTDSVFFEEASQHWANAAILMHNLVTSQGGRLFHFLQPNQYVEGSKPMGDTERAIAIDLQSGYAALAREGYPYLMARARTLAGEIGSIDLTGMFRDHAEPLYKDSCCHLNNRGYELMLDRIMDEVAHGWGAAGSMARPLAGFLHDVPYSSLTLSDLERVAAALELFKEKYGTYPANAEFEGVIRDDGNVSGDWIHGLVPEFLPELPKDARRDHNPLHQYLYRSDGGDYKLISHQPEDCDKVSQAAPDRIDPARNCFAYGYWTPGAANW